MHLPKLRERPIVFTPSPSLARALSVAAGVLLAASLAATLDASPAFAGDVDGIAGSPAADGAVDQSRSRYSYQVEPGQQITDEYLVQNTGSTAQKVTVYATDAFNSEDGNFALRDGNEKPTDVGTWVAFEGGATQVIIDLAPGATQVLPFTVTTPADALPGDHAGGIIVSAITDAGTIALDRRVAIRMYVRVKGDLQPNLTVSSIAASYAGDINPFAGKVSLTMTVKNTGNVALGANTVTNVRGLLGIPLSGDVNIEVPELLPGTTRTITVVVPGVGPWVLLSPHVSLAAIVDPGALNAGPLPKAERETSMFVMPWVLLILLVVIAAIIVFVRLRRRMNDRRAQAWIEYTEAEARRVAREEEEAAAALAAAAAAAAPFAAKRPSRAKKPTPVEEPEPVATE
jgi:dihydroorotate dehydrogenase (fumarate)